MCYTTQICRLRRKKSVSKRLNIVRRSTRLMNSCVSYDQKCSPAKSYLLKLFVYHVHLKFFRTSRSFISTFLCMHCHFTGNLTNFIKLELHRCVTCLRFKAQSKEQIMGNLPVDLCLESILLDRFCANLC